MKNDDIRNKIDTCPVCGNTEFEEGERFQVWNDEMEINYSCSNCGHSWIEIWKFISNIECEEK